MKKLLKGIKNYLSTIKGMTFKEKVEHTWEYYKWVFGALAGVVAFAIFITTCIINVNTQIILSGTGVNIELKAEGLSYVKSEFFEKYKTTGRQDVEYSGIVINDFSTTQSVDSSYYSAQSVVAQVAAKRLDYLLMDEIAFQYFSGQEIYMDLRDILTEEEMTEWADRIVYVQEEGATEMYPMGINIKDTKFVKDACANSGDVFLSFAGNAPNKELAHEFFHYLLKYGE